MKKSVILSLTVIIAIFVSGNVLAQAKARTEIASVKQIGETVRFTLMSSKPFIYGNNKYILHIGDKDFSRYEQSKNKGKGYIAFLIPADDFNKLPNDKSMYLAYGHVSEDADMDEFAKQSARCWPLGKFNQDLLTK